jgi:gamma-glutamyltranspeptidase
MTEDGTRVMSFGVMGGTMQPQGQTQTVVRMPITARIHKRHATAPVSE